MNRRKFISISGAVAVSTLAGCSSSGDGDGNGGDSNGGGDSGVVASETVSGENVAVEFEAESGQVITIRLERLSGQVASVALADTDDEHLFDFRVLRSADEDVKEQTHTAEESGTWTAYVSAEEADIQISLS